MASPPAEEADASLIPGVSEQFTSCGATKPMRHNYRGPTLEPLLHSKRSRAPQLEKACAQQGRPRAAVKKERNFKKKLLEGNMSPSFMKFEEGFLRKSKKTHFRKKKKYE